MAFGQPFNLWTEGAALTGWRELRYGTFVFPLTGQEKTRDLKLGQDRKKIPGGWGDFIAFESSVAGREVELIAAVGSGMIGSQGNMLADQVDHEAERSLLAGLQVLGRQPLYVYPDKYLLAYLIEFEFAYMQDAGAFRYSDWTLKFVADDPRYYGAIPTSIDLGPFTDTTANSTVVSHNGNVRAYPIITITDACTSPSIEIAQAFGGVTKLIKITFSQLTMAAGDTLVINCDPRPENRDQAVIYTPSGGTPVNGLQYCLITDFVNTLNVEEWFPYIEATSVALGTQTFYVQSTVAGSYSCNITWKDTWL